MVYGCQQSGLVRSGPAWRAGGQGAVFSSFSPLGVGRGGWRWLLQIFGVLVSWVFLGLSGGLLAAEQVIVDELTRTVRLVSHLSYLRDGTGRMELEDVRGDWPAGWEDAGDRQQISFGFVDDAIWARFVVSNASEEDLLFYVALRTARMDEVDAYVVHGVGEVEHFVSGNSREETASKVDYKHPVFPLHVRGGEEVECYLRVHSGTQVRLPLELWEVGAFAGEQVRDEVFFAGFFGYLTALVLVGFIFSGFTGDRGYAIYSFGVLGIFVGEFILSGYYAWFGLPARGFMVKSGLILVTDFALFMKLVFVRYLLDMSRTMPRLERWVRGGMWLCGVFGFALVFIPYRFGYPLFAVQLILMGIALLGIALEAWRRGHRGAQFYFLAWLVFWVGFVVVEILWLARIPMPHLPVVYVLVLTSISVTLFLVAMADRVRGIRRQARESERQVLDLERQAGRELRRKMHEEQLLIRDLHDGIGGLTANVAILAEVGRREAETERDERRFERISQLASDGGAEVHSLMNSIEAREMTWADFFDECRDSGRKVLGPHGIAFSFEERGHGGQPDPGVFPGLSLLRVVREAMTNIVKHAGCSEVRMAAEFAGGKLRVAIQDNGCGMPEHIDKGRGLGNMESRIREMGGGMSWANEGGLRLVFEVPLPVVLVDRGGDSGDED